MRMVDYKPKVSIVIPAYNASNYLAEAIESAMAQTYENIEIIVVNDGSKDNGETANVAEKYKDKIIYIEKENGGSSSALNCGIANMTGEWFSWLSHDDLYYTEKIETQINYMNNLGLEQQELQSHVFFTASELIDENGKCIRTPSPNHEEKVSNQVQTILGNQYLIAEPTKYTFHGCSCLIHRSIFESIGGFDEKLRIVNDMDMWFRIYASNYKIHYISDILVKGRVHSKQISRRIGYSYHNPEQDMFWNRSLDWLIENYKNESELFFLFGKNAYLKTRNTEAKRAFKHCEQIDPSYKLKLKFIKILLIVITKSWNILKKLYVKLKV